MIEKLREHLIARLGQDPAGIGLVLNEFKPVEARKNTLLLIEGEVCRYVYFVVQGCLQVFVHDADMNETTRDLVIEDNWCSELMSFGKQQPATENIRAIEPVRLLAISREGFQEMMEKVPLFDRVYRQILEASYANSVYRLNSFASLSALERIKWLMEYRPGLMTRLPGKVIASYLGINKDVFSRLRAQL